jgi:hypothetical protein
MRSKNSLARALSNKKKAQRAAPLQNNGELHRTEVLNAIPLIVSPNRRADFLSGCDSEDQHDHEQHKEGEEEELGDPRSSASHAGESKDSGYDCNYSADKCPFKHKIVLPDLFAETLCLCVP